MRFAGKAMLAFLATFAVLIALHLPLLRLPYFWDEAGYYVPAALDFYHSWLLIPKTTLPVGHTALVLVYLGLAWRLLGYSTWVARTAMLLLATATVVSLYVLARRLADREIAVWSALLLALSPLFFAQTTLVHLDLAAALFTTLAVLFLLSARVWLFALAASLAVLSKETAVVLLPVVWLFTWRKDHARVPERPLTSWIPLVAPVLPLAAWALYYHHATGYWTGNRGYLSYNLYSTLSPVRMFWSLLRRAYELLIAGFNWLLTASALVGFWWGRRDSGSATRDPGLGNYKTGHGGSQSSNSRPSGPGSRIEVSESRGPQPDSRTARPEARDASLAALWRPFFFLTAGLIIIYLLMLSVVGGAILPRYLLPVVPLFYLAAIAILRRLPDFPARLILAATACCFVAAWFINPPYPFPFEDNLAYADFIRLHQQAANCLERQPGQPRILTAWPATDELTNPFLGYVRSPLRVVSVSGFAPQELADVAADSFDLLYLYSRRWEPPGNLLERYPAWLRMQGRYFDYQPQAAVQAIVTRYHLSLVAELERRGQWVQIYGH
jgi:4-amino-4-deoxy-L-arabinose transferase-like glycosyltransferase